MSWRAAFIAIVVAGLLLRLGLVLATADTFQPGSDSADFDRHGVALATTGEVSAENPIAPGKGPTAFRPPGFIYTLGATYAVVGTEDAKLRWTAARIVQVLLGGLAAALGGLLALQLAGRGAAVATAALLAFDPTLVMLSTSLLSEPLFIAVMLGAALAVTRYSHDPRWRWVVAAGVLAGVATVTRANGLIVVLAVGLAAWATARRRSPGAGARAALVVALSAACVVAPWTIRNVRTLDAFVPVSTETGYTLAGMYNRDADAADARWTVPFRAMLQIAEEQPRARDAQWDAELTEHALAYIRDDPAYLLEVGFWNALRITGFYQPGRDRELEELVGIPPQAAAAGVYGAFAVMPLLLLGLIAGGRRALPGHLWLAAALLAASAIFAGGGNARYRAPTEAILIVGAGSGLSYLARRRLTRAGEQPPPGCQRAREDSNLRPTALSGPRDQRRTHD